MRKYIGIDYGDVRIGISTCDSLGILASGLCVIDKQKQTISKKLLIFVIKKIHLKLY